MRCLLLLLAFQLSTWACSVPVFRYALERWPADPHLLQMPQGIQAGTLGSADVNAWVEASNDDQAHFFFPDDSKAWYQGPFAASELPALYDSPLRRRIVAELAGGTTAVFVYLGPAGAELQRIRSDLQTLQKTVKLPEEDPLYDEGSQPEANLPLRIAFSLHHMPEAPEERWLHRQFLGIDADYQPASGPLLIAIYGRGRAFALYGQEGLSAKTLEELAWFLCGACSCQIKSLNPGKDLLLAIDWDSQLSAYPNTCPVHLPDGSSFDLTPLPAAP